VACYFTIRRILTTTSEWKPVVCPKDCSKIVLRNDDSSNRQLLRTDKNDAAADLCNRPREEGCRRSARHVQVLCMCCARFLLALRASFTGLLHAVSR